MKNCFQFGVVGTVTFSENLFDGNATAYQKFLPTGPIALLPLSSSKSSLVWTLPPKTAKELVKFDPKSFSKILNSNLSNRKHADIIDAAVVQVKQWLPSGRYSLMSGWRRIQKVLINRKIYIIICYRRKVWRTITDSMFIFER
jgi:2-polyprenyl-6-methoxyphenol hydroxylase-like FAD-dependent oxidoreductase